MPIRKDRSGLVLENVKVQEGIYKLVLGFDDFEQIKAGQFIHVQLNNKEHVLRRPFCICDFDEVKKTITIVYAIVGEGTRLLSLVKEGERLNSMFPLGNGFEDKGYKKIMILGGGMGCAVLPAMKVFKNSEIYTYIGFASKDKVILEDELTSISKKIVVASDDGSYKNKGFALSYLKEDIEKVKPDVILACGPEGLYKAMNKVLAGIDVPVYISLEARMGCGIGACLVCNCKVKKNGEETYLRVCKDGPVFRLDEVVL